MSAAFFHGSTQYAVVGASQQSHKYGYKVLNWYLLRKLPAIPVNKTVDEVLGVKAVPSLDKISSPSTLAVSIITPPAVSLEVLRLCRSLGIAKCKIWLQPGAEDSEVRKFAKEAWGPELDVGEVTLGGPCILVQGDDLRADSTEKL